jgi:hypothetical protein
MKIFFDNSAFPGLFLQKYQDSQPFRDEDIFLINNRMLIPNGG